MIISFVHKGLKKFYETSSKAGIQPNHVNRLRLILSLLDTAQSADDLLLPNLRLHELQGERNGVWSVWVNGNWRITFRFVGQDVELVNYEDYH